jgi:hypothetical protein
MKIRQVLAVVALAIGTAAVAKADTCSNQAVVTGMVCSLGDLTFTFDLVNGIPSGALTSLDLSTPPTSAGNPVVLGFQLSGTTGVDIHLIYQVQSTSADIVALDSSFPFIASSPGHISEVACSVDPSLPANEGNCPPADILGSALNTTGGITFTSPNPFGPVSSLWIDKDITPAGFSSFTDTVEEIGVTPEPSSIALFGTGMLAAAGVVRRRLVK